MNTVNLFDNIYLFIIDSSPENIIRAVSDVGTKAQQPGNDVYPVM